MSPRSAWAQYGSANRTSAIGSGARPCAVEPARGPVGGGGEGDISSSLLTSHRWSCGMRVTRTRLRSRRGWVTVALVIVWSTKIVTTTWSVLSEAIPAPGQLVRNRPELVLEALTDPSVGWHPPKAPGTGSLRTDLLAGLHGFARMLDQPRGQALRPLMTQRARHPELYAEVHRLLVQPRLELVLQILRAGVERGEVAPEAVTPRIAAVGAWLVIGEHMEKGRVTLSDVQASVSEVLLPILRPHSNVGLPSENDHGVPSPSTEKSTNHGLGLGTDVVSPPEVAEDRRNRRTGEYHRTHPQVMLAMTRLGRDPEIDELAENVR